MFSSYECKCALHRCVNEFSNHDTNFLFSFFFFHNFFHLPSIVHLRTYLFNSHHYHLFEYVQVQNFFTSAESKAFIEAAESIGFVHQGSLGPTRGEAFRDNDRTSLNDPMLAEAIWESGLKRLFTNIKIRGKVAVGLNPNIRFYRCHIFSCL